MIWADHNIWIFYYEIVARAHIEFEGGRLNIVSMHFSKVLIFHSTEDELWVDSSYTYVS